MEKEYSNEVRGKVIAYRFTKKEKQVIAECLKPYLKKIDKKIQRIENNPKNEGQANFLCQIDDLFSEKKEWEKIIDEFLK